MALCAVYISFINAKGPLRKSSPILCSCPRWARGGPDSRFATPSLYNRRHVSRVPRGARGLMFNQLCLIGANEFRAQVSSIPPEFLPSPTATIELQRHLGGDIFTSRLQFISRYAEFHNMFSRGERRAALKYLVVMLSAGIVPKFWWGVVLLDAGGMLDGQSSFGISMPELSFCIIFMHERCV